MSNIPASLAPFFKEYHLQDLDLERSAHTIIERTLRFGNRDADLREVYNYVRALEHGPN